MPCATSASSSWESRRRCCTTIRPPFCAVWATRSIHYTLQGLGYSVQAVISGVGELIGRALGGWLAVHQLGYLGICISNPLAWGFALCSCVVMVTRVLKKESRAA